MTSIRLASTAVATGRTERAFLLNHDDRFFHVTPRLAAQVAAILARLEEGVPLQLIVGEAGIGKTCFLIHLVTRLRRLAHPVVWLPYVPRGQSELAATLSAETSVAACGDLPSWLACFGGQPPIVVMDDLGAASREAMRALAVAASHGAWGARFIGAGPPRLAQRFDGMAPAAINITRLQRLSSEEAIALTRGRLAAANFDAGALFAEDALKRLAAVSGGVPAELVMLCGRTVAAAQRAGGGRAKASLVDRVAAESRGTAGAPPQPARVAPRERHAGVRYQRGLSRRRLVAGISAAAMVLVAASAYRVAPEIDRAAGVVRAAEHWIAAWRMSGDDFSASAVAVRIPGPLPRAMEAHGAVAGGDTAAPHAVRGRPDEASTRAADFTPADELLRRGNAMLALGDVATAREYYERAVGRGDARAATAMGRTYDPSTLRRLGRISLRPDVARAEEWYRRGEAMGDRDASHLRQRLSSP